jgi:hypothetical protein
MHQITVEPLLGEQLASLSGTSILCNSEGRALGFFSPVAGQPRPSELQLEPPRSIEETEELRQRQRGGKSLSEILDKLGLK